MNDQPLELTPRAREMFLAMIPDPAWLDEQIAAGQVVMIQPEKGASPCKA